MINLPRVQDANLKGKIVLVRVDHNVVKKGKIIDAFRIDATLKTIKHINEAGGKLILMTHVGRPKDKETGKIEITETNSVRPIVEYLCDKTGLKIKEVTEYNFDENGISGIKEEMNSYIAMLKNNQANAIYLPNTRWFTGEETGGEDAEQFGKELASFADIYVNDAFGSWQAHASTTIPARILPSFAGFLMQSEIENLEKVFQPKKPLVAVVAGSKFDTKIGAMKALLKTCDYLVLGGVLKKMYFCTKYGFSEINCNENDHKQVYDFLDFAEQYPGKILELPHIIDSEVFGEKIEGKWADRDIRTLDKGFKLSYVLDASPKCFEDDKIRKIFREAGTIFVNAVMGLTPAFYEGTKAMYAMIDENKTGMKYFGGGDTLQEFKTLLPDVYNKALEDENYYFFAGGGTILKAIKEGGVLGLEPVRLLAENGGK